MGPSDFLVLFGVVPSGHEQSQAGDGARIAKIFVFFLCGHSSLNAGHPDAVFGH
jgi:hypothetical protein